MQQQFNSFARGEFCYKGVILMVAAVSSMKVSHFGSKVSFTFSQGLTGGTCEQPNRRLRYAPSVAAAPDPERPPS
jgi:hypothetical protein